MALDPELFKQLLDSFNTELKEHTQTITKGLLSLEKNNLTENEKNKIIETIFRSAHNIKGTSRSLGINEVGEIAHGVESLFAAIQAKELSIRPEIIDICLESVDLMQSALSTFIENKPIAFNIKAFLNRLKKIQKISIPDVKHTKLNKGNELEVSKKNHMETHEPSSIRIPIQKIEKISSLLEEIQVNKISMSDHYSELTRLVSQTKQFSYLWKKIFSSIKNQFGDDLSESIQKLYNETNDNFNKIQSLALSMHTNVRSHINGFSHLSDSLQDEVSSLRMIPAETLLCVFPRYVRDLSHTLNKKVELKIVGEEVKIDKSILEDLKDPLIHLLRNSIDHGIESPEIRKQLGKPETGTITISIEEKNSLVFLSISDDGAGISIEKITEFVLRKKLFTPNELEHMSKAEKLEIIFRSGFSTKDIITDTSGRGVGLDVVKATIESLNGTINISTLPNIGTTFTISVPISIASERGLLVAIAGEQFVIPTSSVERVIITDLNQIIDIQGSQGILLNQRTLPVRNLAVILKLINKTSFTEKKIPMIIIKKSNHAVAFAVDEIIGEREIIIKPFHAPLIKVPCFSGGTLLETNQVIMVLDPSELITQALQSNHVLSISANNETSAKPKRPSILVVDDSITTRTLEKNILENKNYEVTVAVNGKEAWDILQKQKFSLVITDVTMPIMDGFTLTEKVKTSEKFRDLPVIIVTSLGNDAEKQRGIEVGADAYIIKNEFESGALLEIVSQLV